MRSSNRFVINIYAGMIFLVFGCREIQPPDPGIEGIVQVTQQPVLENEIEIIEIIEESSQFNSTNMAVISIGNVDKLSLLKNIYPYFPPIVQISTDGSKAAVGDLSGIQVINLSSNEVLMKLDIPVQTCNFGYRKSFQLNHDGTLLAVALKDRIEVWKVDIGLVHEELNKNGFVLNPLTCGGDIPQMIFSPDGILLVESGVFSTSNELKSYFRITDLNKKKIVYEWDGSSETPHGQLYTYPGLGFSYDGTILQTFDATRYSNKDEKFSFPFRYWSTLDWQELAPNSKKVSNSFMKGNLLFARSENNSVFVFDKRTGKALSSIKEVGCEKEDPCDVNFSPDGTKMGILHKEGGRNFKREIIGQSISTFEIQNGEKLFDYSVQSRNFEDININNDGEVLFYEVPSTDRSDWWTQTDYFSGFRVIDEMSIAFTPQIVINDAHQQEPYSKSCQIRVDTYTSECNDSLLFDNGFSVEIEKKGEGVSIVDTNDNDREGIADIKNPLGEETDNWQFRLLNYSGEAGTGFFCMDRNLRKESCFIMDLVNNEILYEGIDLSGVQYSLISKTAAFIDQHERSLFLFFDENNMLKRINTYHAVALPVKPVFLRDGIEFIYTVQSLENEKNAYIERIDSEGGKVIKRYDINKIKNLEIRSIAVSSKEDIWAVADQSGWVFFIDPAQSAVVFSLQAIEEDIVDMIFSPDGRSVFIIGKSGTISIWSV